MQDSGQAVSASFIAVAEGPGPRFAGAPAAKEVTMSLLIDTGQWMISTPGTPGEVTQHFIPPRSKTESYALSYAYVAPCSGHPLCIPASEKYRRGIPACAACMRYVVGRS